MFIRRWLPERFPMELVVFVAILGLWLLLQLVILPRAGVST
jgi:hypothetical protein